MDTSALAQSENAIETYSSTLYSPLQDNTSLFTEFEVTSETAKELGLTIAEFDAICTVLNRKPTYTELGVYSVMWSEHCSYKNSILQLKTLPRSGGRMLVEAGEENAGLVDIGDGYAIAFKIESHNHPSAIEPVEGAATGVGGILRDIFTMGARPVAALNSLRFGELSTARTKYLVKGVVKGIGSYGNAFGVPTVGGEIYFDNCYTDNPLVNAMAVGIVHTSQTATAEASGVGNSVMIMGSSTGRDGIRGASMASQDFAGNPEDMRPTVQVGDPFSEKLLLEATLELIQSGIVVGMQDMGAAGICCSTSEMSAKGSVGMNINLDNVPLREQAMSAFEIMLSESQERMLVVVEKDKEHIAQEICSKWDVPIDRIGEVTSDGLITISRFGKIVQQIPAHSLVLGGGAPVYEREWKIASYIDTVRQCDTKQFFQKAIEIGNTNLLLSLLAVPTIASKRWVYQQYDSHVGTNTMQKSGGDAAVMRIKELPGKGFAVSTDCNSRYVYLNPYMGGAIAVAEAARNCVCVGAEPVAITNCLNFGNPYDPEVYWQFREAIRGMGDMCRALNTPVTGGNVSFHNESQNHAIFPTPTIGMLGLIENVELSIGAAFVAENENIYLLGWHGNHIGGSEVYKLLLEAIHGDAPSLDINNEVLLQTVTRSLINASLVTAAHDCSEGGLAVALAEMSLRSKNDISDFVGATITNDEIGVTPDYLFGENQSRIIVTVNREKQEQFVEFCRSNNLPCMLIGTTGGSKLSLADISVDVSVLYHTYENGLPTIMNA